MNRKIYQDLGKHKHWLPPIDKQTRPHYEPDSLDDILQEQTLEEAAKGIQHPISSDLNRATTPYSAAGTAYLGKAQGKSFKHERSRNSRDTPLLDREITRLNVSDSLLSAQPEIGLYRQGITYLHGNDDVGSQPCSVEKNQILSAKALAEEELNGKDEVERVGRAYHLGTGFSSEVESTAELLKDTAFTLIAKSSWRKYNPRRSLHTRETFQNYEIRNDNNDVVGAIIDGFLIASDDSFSGEYPHSRDEPHASDPYLHRLLEGAHTFSDDAELVQNPQKATYSGVNSLPEKIIADQFK